MDIALWCLFVLLICIGFIGCFVAKFPGPVMAFIAILMAKIFMTVGDVITWTNVIIIGILVVASIILNRMIPNWTQKLTPYGKGGNWGAIIGSILALILTPALSDIPSAGVAISAIILTFICLPFIFSTSFEFISQKDLQAASKSGVSATIVYVSTTFVKLFTVIYAVYLMFANN